MRRLRNKDSVQVWHAWGDGPRTLLRTTEAKLGCAFAENTLIFFVPKRRLAFTPLGPPLSASLEELRLQEHKN